MIVFIVKFNNIIIIIIILYNFYIMIKYQKLRFCVIIIRIKYDDMILIIIFDTV